MKKQLTLLFILFFTVTAFAVEVAPRKTFNDVRWGYWAKRPIEVLAGLDIINGYPNGNYQPEQIVTRAELTAILVRARLGRLTERSFPSFRDVSTKHWAAPYIDRAVELEWIKGLPSGRFQPNRPVTRAEGIYLLARFDEWIDFELAEKPYADISLNFWAAPSIATAKTKGLLSYLADKNFKPTTPLTRAEVAELLSKTTFISALVNPR
jgi:hypothetical protein